MALKGQKLAPKPLHWVDAGNVTLCGEATNRRRYTGPWEAKRRGVSVETIQAETTCQACRAALKTRGPLPPPPTPTPTPPTPNPEIKDTPVTESTEPTDVTPTPTPTPAPTPKTDQPAGQATMALSALGSLGDSILAAIDERANVIATERAIEAVENLGAGGPVAINWTVNDQPLAEIEGIVHEAVPRILKLYAWGFRNFFCVGPAGSGKSTIAQSVATALNAARAKLGKEPMRFGEVSCSEGMSETVLTGSRMPNVTGGPATFLTTEMIRCYEGPGVFHLDEVDGANANVLLVTNGAVANGHMSLPLRSDNPVAKRHPDSIVICSANTYGTGADRQYVGRNQLDAAFLDRFVGSTLEVDYDRDLESKLVGDPHICARVWQIREAIANARKRRIVGTRFLLSCARIVKAGGETLDYALKACTVGWTSDELTTAGIK